MSKLSRLKCFIMSQSLLYWNICCQEHNLVCHYMIGIHGSHLWNCLEQSASCKQWYWWGWNSQVVRGYRCLKGLMAWDKIEIAKPFLFQLFCLVWLHLHIDLITLLQVQIFPLDPLKNWKWSFHYERNMFLHNTDDTMTSFKQVVLWKAFMSICLALIFLIFI